MNERMLGSFAFPHNVVPPSVALRTSGAIMATAAREKRPLTEFEKGLRDAADAQARYYGWTTEEIEAEIEKGKRGEL